MKSLFYFGAILLLGALVSAADDRQYVPHFPRWPENNTEHVWSGYLDIEDTERRLHYVYLSSKTNNNTAPLLLWLNGGPGCSSLFGFTKEIGPYAIDDGELDWKENPYSWNRDANLLFIESPAGVGFSFNDNSTDWNENKTASDNLQALLTFFSDAKFPELKGRDFYIAGESYAGMYIPFLAQAIVDYNAKNASSPINLKGILVGNGVTEADDASRDAALYEFAYGHHLMTIEQWDIISNICPKDPNAPRCSFAKKQVNSNLAAVNVYDIYRYCYNATTFDKKNPFMFVPWWIKGRNLENWEGTIPCTDTDSMNFFYNDEDVKGKMHIQKNLTWNVCDLNINEKYKGAESALEIYKVLIKANIRVLHYSGDTDMAVPYTSNLIWIRKLKLPIDIPFRQWSVDKQVSGYVIDYKGLSFVTYKGVGHMAPQWKRPEGYKMFSNFLKNIPL